MKSKQREGKQMINQIKIMSRGEVALNKNIILSGDIATMNNCNRLAIISIFNSDSISPFEQKQEILALAFDDVTHNESTQFTFMSNTQATEIVDFVNKSHNSPDSVVLLIHCDKGISRSGAVGEFARRVAGISRHELLKENPRIWPNPAILNLLLKSSGRENEKGWDY